MLAQKRYSCPCCGFDTLEELNVFDDCFLCYWEDDGQGDHGADEPNYGVNGDMSLTEARTNFLDHGHKYPLDGTALPFAIKYPTRERRDWVRYALSVRKGDEPLDKALFESLRIADEFTRELE